MSYATNRGHVWFLDNVKKRGNTAFSNVGVSGGASGPSSLPFLQGASTSCNPQGK